MKTVKFNTRWITAVVLATCFASTNVMAQTSPGEAQAGGGLSNADAENIVRRSLQYVALYDTLLNFTFNKKNPFASGGWNKTHYPEGLMDASVRAIPRPNNDTLYVLSLLDLRQDPVVIHWQQRHELQRADGAVLLCARPGKGMAVCGFSRHHLRLERR